MVEEGEGVIDRYRNGGKVEGCKKKKKDDAKRS